MNEDAEVERMAEDSLRLKKALDCVGGQLDKLPPGTPIQIEKLKEADRPEDGSLYSITWPTVFACSRGGG